MRKFSIILFSLLTLFCMAFIFAQSAKNGEASSSASSGISDNLAEVIRPENPETDRIPSTGGLVGTRRTFLFKVSEFVRTGAPVLEFAALTFFAYLLALSAGAAKTKKARLWTIPSVFLFGALYALSDEVHQKFVPGRSFQWQDVGFDTLGALLGILAAFLAYLLFARVQKKRAAKQLSK